METVIEKLTAERQLLRIRTKLSPGSVLNVVLVAPAENTMRSLRELMLPENT